MYWQLNKDTRKGAMKGKKEIFNTLEGNAERATGQGNIKRLYDRPRRMARKGK